LRSNSDCSARLVVTASTSLTPSQLADLVFRLDFDDHGLDQSDVATVRSD